MTFVEKVKVMGVNGLIGIEAIVCLNDWFVLRWYMLNHIRISQGCLHTGMALIRFSRILWLSRFRLGMEDKKQSHSQLYLPLLKHNVCLNMCAGMSRLDCQSRDLLRTHTAPFTVVLLVCL